MPPWTIPSLSMPLADAGVAQEVDRPLLQDARADPPLDVVAAAALQDDRLDALAGEKLGERQAGGAGADDADLRPHRSSSTRWAIANAELAAGTPQ